MKKLLAVALLVSASTALAACGTGAGHIETQAPYAEERTAGGTNTPPAYERVEVRTAEPVFVERTTK